MIQCSSDRYNLVVSEVSLVPADQLTCWITVDNVQCEAEKVAESHHVVARAGVVGLLLCPDLRWLMLTSLAVAAGCGH